MGFWNVEAKDLRVGDEIRVTSMGGTEFLVVKQVKDSDRPEVRVALDWGWHVSITEPFWDTLPANQMLTVRR
jgi:hypothetical protein